MQCKKVSERTKPIRLKTGGVLKVPRFNYEYFFLSSKRVPFGLITVNSPLLSFILSQDIATARFCN